MDHVSFQVESGEFLVLVGPSGCGKSTTLRLIAGLEEITSGVITIGGKVVNNVMPKDRDIAMVFQNYALYPHMSVFENMAFGLTLRGLPSSEIRSRVEEAAAILGLTSPDNLLHRKPKALSGGQRQRVALGRAMVRKPKVFLFDEPLSNLDAKMRVEMRDEIVQLHRRVGATMIYVTHDQVEAMTLADRIVVMNSGIIEQIATPNEIYNRPASLFVADFVGSPGFNLIEGTYDPSDHVFVSSVGERLQFDQTKKPSTLPSRVILGFRAESAILGVGGEGLSFRLDYVEDLGSVKHVQGYVAGQKIIIAIKNDHVIPTASDLRLMLKPEDLHVFDPLSGRRL